VTLIHGDGIGPEVIAAAAEVIAAAGVDIVRDRLLAGAAAVEAGDDPVPEPLIRSIHR
jgi:isocitrate dehydrogenase (NAD+)